MGKAKTPQERANEAEAKAAKAKQHADFCQQVADQVAVWLDTANSNPAVVKAARKAFDRVYCPGEANATEKKDKAEAGEPEAAN